jgi:hypothetical protein
MYFQIQAGLASFPASPSPIGGKGALQSRNHNEKI